MRGCPMDVLAHGPETKQLVVGLSAAAMSASHHHFGHDGQLYVVRLATWRYSACQPSARSQDSCLFVCACPLSRTFRCTITAAVDLSAHTIARPSRRLASRTELVPSLGAGLLSSYLPSYLPCWFCSADRFTRALLVRNSGRGRHTQARTRRFLDRRGHLLMFA